MIDYSDARWAKPHIARIVSMGIGPSGETITCEAIDGDCYQLNLSGTKLHGFVSEFMSGAWGFNAQLPVWAEFGMVSPFVPYIELLYTSEAFDKLPRNLRRQTFESADGYRQIKRAHLVPVSVYDREDLYYGQLF